MQSRLSKKFSVFERTKLLPVLASLSLHQNNHSQNIRIRYAILAALLGESDTHREESEIDLQNLKNIILESLPASGKIGIKEDPQECLFTDTIQFHGGDYLIYPDIMEDEITGLTNILQTIFHTRNSLPNDLKADLYFCTKLILGLSQKISDRVQHHKYLVSPFRHREEIYFPDTNDINRYSTALVFDLSEAIHGLDEYFSLRDISARFNILELSSHSLSEDPDLNPLISRPLVIIDNKIVVLAPQCLVPSLTHYIIKTLSYMGLVEDFVSIYRLLLWRKVALKLRRAGYEEAHKLSQLQNHIPIQDGLFLIDDNKVAYVVLLFDNLSNLDAKYFRSQWVYPGLSELYQTRFLSICDEYIPLKYEGFEILSIVLLASHGRNFSFQGIYTDDIFSVSMLFHELELLIFGRKQTPLSLWQFARSRRDFEQKSTLISTSFYDVYSFYTAHNSGFYFSDERSDFLNIAIGYGNAQKYETKVLNDRQLGMISKSGMISVIRYYSDPTIPIYLAEDVAFPLHFYVKHNQAGIWVVPNSDLTSSPQGYSLYEVILESITYWIWQFSPSINKFLSSSSIPSIVLEISIDKIEEWSYLQKYDEKVEITKLFKVAILEDRVQIRIPLEFAGYIFLKDNKKDRILIGILIDVFEKTLFTNSVPSSPEKEIIIENHAPLGIKTMIHGNDSDKRPMLVQNNLPSLRMLSETYLELFTNNLAENIGCTGVREFVGKKEKNSVCHKVVSYYFDTLKGLISAFPGQDLLSRLVALNEAIWRKRAENKLRLPSLLACFGDNESKRQELIETNVDIDRASLSIRCLIEIVSAIPPNGEKIVNDDDLDAMLACMQQIISWGSLSDEIKHDLHTGTIRALDSKRLSIDRTFHDTVSTPYGFSKHAELLELQREFESNESNDQIEFELREHFKRKGFIQSEEIGYLDEFGFTKQDLLTVANALVQIGLESSDPFVWKTEEELINDLSKSVNLSNEVVDKVIEVLKYENRTSWESVPAEFSLIDIYPWRYGRRLSLLLKPLCSLSVENKGFLLYGFRQVLNSVSHIITSIENGKFPASSTAMIKHLGKVVELKGRIYNSIIHNWFLENLDTDRFIIKQNVKLPEIGDIDVLIIDTIEKFVFMIECKNINAAKTTSEYVIEFKRFDKENSGWVDKNLRRLQWVRANLDTFSNSISQDLASYVVETFFLINERIPYPLLKRRYSDTQFFYFTDLKQKGFETIIQKFKEINENL